MPQYTDRERHEGRRRIVYAGVDASLTESVDAEHIHAGLRAGYRHRDHAGYRHRAHAGYRHRAHGSSSLVHTIHALFLSPHATSIFSVHFPSRCNITFLATLHCLTSLRIYFCTHHLASHHILLCSRRITLLPIFFLVCVSLHNLSLLCVSSP